MGELLKRVQLAGYLQPAAVSMGIPVGTAHAWMAKGAADAARGRPTTVYAIFAERVACARADGELYHAGKLYESDDWRARARILESIAPRPLGPTAAGGARGRGRDLAAHRGGSLSAAEGDHRARHRGGPQRHGIQSPGSPRQAPLCHLTAVSRA